MVARIVIGNLPGGTRGVRVSQAGYDALTNPPLDDALTFNSDWPDVLGIKMRGRIFITGSTAALGPEVSVAMPITGFNYIPLGFFFFKGNGQYQGTTFRQYLDWVDIERGRHYDTGNGYVRVQVRSTNVTFTYRRINNTATQSSSYPLGIEIAYTLFNYPVQ